MKTLNVVTVEFSKDTYSMEVLEASFGTKFYRISINGIFQKTYQRLPKSLKDFFNY